MSVFVLNDGTKLYVSKEILNNKGSIRILYNEPLSLNTLISLSSKDYVFVDVGANIGRHSIIASRYYKHVIAFEPHPIYYNIFLKNIELNNCKNINAYQIAITNFEGNTKLYDFYDGASTLQYEKFIKIYDVKANKLDNLVDVAHVLKIDTFGAEYSVILGMQRLLTNYKPILIIEYHHKMVNTELFSDEIFKHLRQYGYYCLKISNRHRVFFPKSTPPELIYYPLACHWINHCIENIENNKPWYLGIPYEWWWGMNLTDFIIDIFNHVKSEPEWYNILIRQQSR